MINRTALRNKALLSKSPLNTSAIRLRVCSLAGTLAIGDAPLGLVGSNACHSVQTGRMHPAPSLFQQV
jgi:hypothetical protein